MRTALRIVLLGGLSAVLLLTSACRDRAVGTLQDAGPVADASQPTDAAVGPDALSPCTGDPLAMGFVLGPGVTPTHPEPEVDDYDVTGTAIYHGTINEPLATHPDFEWEVQLQQSDGTTVVLQYYLPLNLRLPVAEGGPYQLLFRKRWGFDGYVVGLILWRVTSGIPPLLFVGDTGTYGRAFSAEEPLMNPLKVYVEPRAECPAEPDPRCGGSLYRDALRFDSSTGGAITEVEVPQGAMDTLSVFGQDHFVVNLSSFHTDTPCLDDPDSWVSYLSVDRETLPPLCDEDRLYYWDQPRGIEVGMYCDILYFCTDDWELQAAALNIAPELECGPDGDFGCPDGPTCRWPPHPTIDQSLYGKLCAISILPNAPDAIRCGVYLD